MYVGDSAASLVAIVVPNREVVSSLLSRLDTSASGGSEESV